MPVAVDSFKVSAENRFEEGGLVAMARTPARESDLARKIEAQGGKRGTSRKDLAPTCLFMQKIIFLSSNLT